MMKSNIEASVNQNNAQAANLGNPEALLTLWGNPDTFNDVVDKVRRATYNESFGSIVTSHNRIDVVLKENAKKSDVEAFINAAQQNNIFLSVPSELFVEKYLDEQYMDMSNMIVSRELSAVIDMFKNAQIQRVQDEVEPEDLSDEIEAYNIYFNEDVIAELVSRTSLLKDCDVSSFYELLTDTDVTVYCIAEYKDHNLSLSLVRESDEYGYKDYTIPLSDKEKDCVNRNIDQFLENDKKGAKKPTTHKQYDEREI